MKTLEDLRRREESLMFKTYGRYPLSIARGQGSRVWDHEGKEYVDLLAGIAVTGVGHANPEIGEVIAKQAEKLIHVSNLFYQQEQLDLAEALLGTTHFGKAFFCNSGAEANEAAIKLARRYQQKVKNRDAYEVITFEGCFHGRTLATVAATGQARFQDGFAPMPEGFRQIAWGDAGLLADSIGTKTAAVLLECVQGEGGIRPVTREFIQAVETICRDRGVLFMVDEVQSGMGRTGAWWAFQHFGVTPDVMTTAKALANGLPMGAMLATDEVARGFEAGSHATTFGGGALLSVVAAKVLEIMRRDRLVERAGELGAWAMERFRAIEKRCPGSIKEVRGMGLMIGIDLARPGKPIWENLLQQGYIANLTQDTVLRLLPALTVERERIESFAQALEKALEN